MTESRQQVRTVDERFDDVAHAFVEQRDFITFCFDRAQKNLTAGLAGVEKRLTGVEGRLTGVEGQLTGVEGQLTGVEGRLTGVEGHLARVERRLDRHEVLLGEILTEVKALRPR